MRKIKFRGISINTGKMVYGDLLQYRVYPVIFDKDKVQHEVSADTVGQYIGLKDKNNKEIYVNDIIQDDEEGLNNNDKEIVKELHWFNVDAFDVYGYEIAIDFIESCFKKKTTRKLQNIKIIDNIHNNPELAKALNKREKYD